MFRPADNGNGTTVPDQISGMSMDADFGGLPSCDDGQTPPDYHLYDVTAGSIRVSG